MNLPQGNSIFCNVCCKKFGSCKTLKVHELKVHRVTPAGNIICRNQECNVGFIRHSALRDHLKEKHNIPIAPNVLEK